METIVHLNTLPDLYSFADAAEVPRQARILDISRYWRTGGTNWEKVKQNFDGVVICAGIGMRMDVLLPEHVDRAKEFKVPYNTFQIPDPLQNMVEQAHWYTEQYGVIDARPWHDNECPGAWSREETGAEGDIYMDALESYHPMTPGEYSRWEIWKRQGYPKRLYKYMLWPAQYWWDKVRYATNLKPYTYRKYEPYFEQRGTFAYPADTPGQFEKNVVAVQITPTGDAQYYAANRLTADPVNVYGMTNADLNVSLLPLDKFMAWFWPQAQQPPVPPVDEPGGCAELIADLIPMRDKLTALIEKWKN